MIDERITMIHQPDLFPWIGYFHKILKVDDLVILDHVKNHPKARNWLRRVKIVVNGDEHWVSIPLKSEKDRSFIPINELSVNKSHPQYQTKIPNTIFHSYKSAKFFDEFFPLIKEHFGSEEENLSKWNMSFIYTILEKLQIDRPTIHFSSSLGIKNSKTDMLIEICEKIGSKYWLKTSGVNGYIELEKFSTSEIKFKDHEFTMPTYHQFNSSNFIGGLSIIDTIMNLGFEGTKELLLKGCKKSLTNKDE